jgi:hypothetical protein
LPQGHLLPIRRGNISAAIFFKKGLRYQSGRVGFINDKSYINYFNGLGARLKNGLRAGGPAAIFLCDGFVNPGKNASDWHTDCL